MASMTAKRYDQQAESFKRWMAEKGLTADNVSYNDMMIYIKEARQAGNGQNTICRKLRGIHHWFDYRYIEPNPCDHINLPSPNPGE